MLLLKVKIKVKQKYKTQSSKGNMLNWAKDYQLTLVSNQLEC